MGAFKDLVAREEYIILDGALGTELERRGYDVSSPLWSAEYLLKNPQIIAHLHRDYLQAGADILTTASYQASLPGLMATGLSEKEALEFIGATVTIAKIERTAFWKSLSEEERTKGPYPLIGGDIGPYAAYLSNGSEYTGAYQLSRDAFQDFHRPRIQALLEAGCDFLIIETIPNVEEAVALSELLMQEFPTVETYMSFVARDTRHIADGTPIEKLAELCQLTPQVVAMGINCSQPKFYEVLLQTIRTICDKPLVAYPNSGEIFDASTGHWCSDPNHSHTLWHYAQHWHPLGVQIIGGCCRTTPNDIARLAQAIRQ